jgi:hypothetical protein
LKTYEEIMKIFAALVVICPALLVAYAIPVLAPAIILALGSAFLFLG